MRISGHKSVKDFYKYTGDTGRGRAENNGVMAGERWDEVSAYEHELIIAVKLLNGNSSLTVFS